MMMIRNLSAMIGGLLLACSPGLAKDIYVAQSSTGPGNGANCADARVYTWFNSAANWGAGAGKISAGDTVHICGTITVAAGAYGVFAFQASGTTGGPITLLFEPGALLQSPQFDGRGAIRTNGNSYIVIDGGTNGIIQNTNNGSALTYQQPSTGIDGSNCSFCEFKNLTIQNIYVHSLTTDLTSNIITGGCVYWNGSQSNVSVHDNTLHDAPWCLTFTFTGTDSNVSFYNNRIYNVDHGITIGGGGGNSIAHVAVYNNHIGDYANWDTTFVPGVGCVWHHDGLHLFPMDTATSTDVNIYDNLFDGNPGTGGCANSHIYAEFNSSNVNIFNNVFTAASTGAYQFNYTSLYGDGLYAADGDSIYNNTYLGGGAANLLGICSIVRNTTNLSIKNNVFSNCVTAIDGRAPNTLVTGGLNNNVYTTPLGVGQGEWHWNSAWYNSLAAWRSATGQDSNALGTASPMLNADGTVQVGSPVIGVGANLTSLGIAALDSDKTGKPRPGAGSWTAGAYIVGPAPPMGLTAAPH
jgi:hypothetical protein